MTAAARAGGPVVVAGCPTALGGHLAGMEQAPGGLRALGLIERLRDALAPLEVIDAGDLEIEPGFREDPDPRAKNRDLIAATLPRFSAFVADALAASPGARLLVLGGDCTAHPAALAGLRRADPGRRLSLTWFDAHGDFNTPATTPSGNVWGMPFAMACGRGEPDLVRAVEGPVVAEADCALLGGQVLDEEESRMLAASGVAQFGAGMLAGEAGRAALAAWAAVVAGRTAGFYVAFDADCLDRDGGWAVQMPEPAGLALETAVGAIRSLAASGPIAAFGPTGVNLGNGDAATTRDAIVELAAAAFSPAP